MSVVPTLLAAVAGVAVLTGILLIRPLRARRMAEGSAPDGRAWLRSVAPALVAGALAGALVVVGVAVAARVPAYGVGVLVAPFLLVLAVVAGLGRRDRRTRG